MVYLRRLDGIKIIINYLKNKDSKLIPEKVSIDDTSKEYFLSINIYNCSVPIIPGDDDVTRCEINTYVRDPNEGIGASIEYSERNLPLRGAVRKIN